MSGVENGPMAFHIGHSGPLAVGWLAMPTSGLQGDRLPGGRRHHQHPQPPLSLAADTSKTLTFLSERPPASFPVQIPGSHVLLPRVILTSGRRDGGSGLSS